MTLDDLYGHLLAHELRLEQNQPAVDLALASANIAAKKGSSRGGRGGRSQQFFSSGRGHNSNNNSNRNFHGRGHGRGSTTFCETFSETFSPIVKPTTVRIVLSIAISLGWQIRQIDVHNAFLHGFLSEDVFMHQPLGYVHPDYPNHICKLQKALYGLKQAPRAWFSRLTSKLISLGFKGCCSDTSLFIYKNHLFTMYILIYVDDILITCSNSSAITKLISLLVVDFSIKDLGSLNFSLGIEVLPHENGVLLSQR